MVWQNIKQSDCGGKSNFTNVDSAFSTWYDINSKVATETLNEAAAQLVDEGLFLPIEKIAASASGGAGNAIFTKAFCSCFLFLSLTASSLTGRFLPLSL